MVNLKVTAGEPGSGSASGAGGSSCVWFTLIPGMAFPGLGWDKGQAGGARLPPQGKVAERGPSQLSPRSMVQW